MLRHPKPKMQKRPRCANTESVLNSSSPPGR
nr:MAG TPA: hypothetical protein [Caudoviricetes sp.]